MVIQWRSIFAMIAALALVAGCQRPAAEETGATEEAVDTESARAQLESSARAWEQAVSAGDPAGLADYYAEDAVLLPEDMPRAEGKAAIEARLAEMFGGMPPSSLTLVTDDFVVSESGDIAYAIGTARQTGTMSEGQPFEYVGKWVVVMRNVGGEWKVVADIWNADAAMAGGSVDASVSTPETSGSEAPTDNP